MIAAFVLRTTLLAGVFVTLAVAGRPVGASADVEDAVRQPWRAAPDQCVVATDPADPAAVPVGAACFSTGRTGTGQAEGAQVQVVDLARDGHRVGARWRSGDGRHGVCAATTGPIETISMTSSGTGGAAEAEEKDFSRGFGGLEACEELVAQFGVDVWLQAGTCEVAVSTCARTEDWSWGTERHIDLP